MVRREPNRIGLHTVHGRAARHAWVVALLYAAMAICWIVSSDHVLGWITQDQHLIQALQTAKGSLFVLTSTALVYTLVYKRMIILLRRNDALQETHAHLRAIFEASPQAIYTINHQGHIRLWNSTAQRMFGWSDTEVQGIPHPGIPEEDWDEYADIIRQLHQGRQLRDHPARQLRKDGRIIDVSISTAPLYDHEGQIAETLVMVADITERHRTLTLQRERDGLKTRTRAMEEVLGIVGHELRTPLTSLQAISEVLLTEHITDIEEHDRLVKAINEETIRLSGMVSNMLEAARLDSGVAKWQWSVVDVGVLCRDTLEIIRPQVDQSRIKLSTNATAGRHIMKGDEDAIRRLLVNLVANANKNTRQGEIHINIRSMYDKTGRWIVLAVHDTGRGISPTLTRGLGRAFALNQGAVSHDARHTGAGLGLAICRGIVAAHGGHIAVSSTPGKGTTFTVALRSNLAEPVMDDNQPNIIQQVAQSAAVLA